MMLIIFAILIIKVIIILTIAKIWYNISLNFRSLAVGIISAFHVIYVYL